MDSSGSVSQLDQAVHVHLDGKRLAGYWNACRALTGDCDPSDPHTTQQDRINSLIRAQDYQVGQTTAPQDQNLTLNLLQGSCRFFKVLQVLECIDPKLLP